MESNRTKLTPTGATPYSGLKIFAHTDRLELVKQGRPAAPIYIRIKPTNLCNQNCYYCHYRNPYLTLDQYRSKDSIPRDKMMEIINDMKEIGVKAVTFSGGGEPLLYPYIEEAMELILDKGIDLSIITNGALLSGKKAELLAKAKWVRISEESGKAETYSKIRGVGADAFSTLCKNIKEFAQIKDKSCELGVNFVIGPENHKEVYMAGKLMSELGVNHIKYTAQMSNETERVHGTFKQDVIDQIHRLSDDMSGGPFKVINLYESDFDSNVRFERDYSKCWVKEFLCVIAANSKVYFCHDKAYLSDGEIGDLSECSFKELWFSDKVREKFLTFNPQISCKHHCVYDERNQLLNNYFFLDENHINFI